MKRRWICTAPASAIDAPAKVAAGEGDEDGAQLPLRGAEHRAEVDLGQLGEHEVAGHDATDERDDGAQRDPTQLDRRDLLRRGPQGHELVAELPEQALVRLEGRAGVRRERDRLQHRHSAHDGLLAEGSDRR